MTKKKKKEFGKLDACCRYAAIGYVMFFWNYLNVQLWEQWCFSCRFFARSNECRWSGLRRSKIKRAVSEQVQRHTNLKYRVCFSRALMKCSHQRRFGFERCFSWVLSAGKETRLAALIGNVLFPVCILQIILLKHIQGLSFHQISASSWVMTVRYVGMFYSLIYVINRGEG